MSEFVAWLDRLPDAGVYVALALGAGLENFIPAVPADTFVALGGFLAGAGQLRATWVVLGTWLCNVGGALFVYRLSLSHGPGFFARGWGKHVLRPHQMERMAGFYARWGAPALFLSRFLPGVRAVAPVFAGTTGQPWPKVLFPLAIASGIWYTGLVRIGVVAGQNLDFLDRMLGDLNRTLAAVAIVVGVGVGWWWYRTRRAPDG